MQEEPIALALKLRAKYLADETESAWFWLHSGSFGEAEKSLLGFGTEIIECTPSTEAAFRAFLTNNFIADAAGDHPAKAKPSENIFVDGWVVAFAYEFGRAWRPRGLQEAEPVTAVAIRIAEIYETGPLPANPSARDETIRGVFSTKFDHGEYLQIVSAAKESVRAGEANVLCVTNQFSIPADRARDPLSAFIALQHSSAAPRASIIEWKGQSLITASPERFIVKRDSHIGTMPIKGTAARAATPAEDEASMRSLATNPKEAVEIERVVNEVLLELAPISEPGTLKSAKPLVQSYRQVHQLVADISATLRADSSFWQLFDAIFPAASMVGAPKQKALRLLETLEFGPRGFYSGCFGLISKDSSAVELAMTIRSIEYFNGAATVGAGGGITEDSDPEKEWQEMSLKARAMLAALV